MAYANFLKWSSLLQSTTWLLWVLTLAFRFPYIANTLGWMTAELGRQPWLIYGLFHTRDGCSKVVKVDFVEGFRRKVIIPAWIEDTTRNYCSGFWSLVVE